MSIFFWMILLTDTKRYEQVCVQISPESQWYMLDPRFPQDREVIVWIKISLEIDGHWGTAPTCIETPPSKILLVRNNHPPHIDINRQVWNPKIWQSHVNYRFWSGWVVPRRQKRLGEERLAEALRVAHPGCSSSFTMGPRCVQGNYKLQTGEQTKL